MLDNRFSCLFDTISDVVNLKCKKALLQLTALLESNGDMGMAEEFAYIKDDYNRMTSYWLNDVKDPCLENMINGLARRIANFISEYSSRLLNQEDSCYLLTLKRQAGKKGDSWIWSDIRHKLESFVSDEALAGLDFAGEGEERLERIIDEHYEYSQRLFNHIATMGLICGNEVDDVIDLLCSPTVDSGDQQLIVSALTLSGSRAFDINKFKVMAHVCRKGATMRVRQRALVGFVLTQGYNMNVIYKEQNDIFAETIADEDIASQLVELQMQMLFCKKAESDSDVLEKEIMPEMLKNSPIRINKGKLEEKEDSIEDILGGNDEESRAEEVERLINKMNGMQKAGSDIFFNGFSHMKNFPFFDNMVNWFLPFSNSNKNVRQCLKTYGGAGFLELLFSNTSFCDSDRFSFVFAFEHVVKRMPSSILEHLNTSNLNTDKGMEETPTLYRRNYLQCLYRFFKLFKWSNGYFSPFVQWRKYKGACYWSHGNRSSYVPFYVFIVNTLFLNTRWLEENLPRLMLFFCKNHYEGLDIELMAIIWPYIDTYEGNMARGKFYDTFLLGDSGLEYYQRALELKPNSVIAKKKVALHLMEYNPEEAKKMLMELKQEGVDSPSMNYHLALSCLKVGDYTTGLPLLYKLEYMYPEDDKINALFGATLLLGGNIEKAYAVFDKVMDFQSTKINSIAFLVACWLKTGSVTKTIEAVKSKNITIAKDSGDDYDYDDHEKYEDVLFRNGICRAELEMMYEEVSEEWCK